MPKVDAYIGIGSNLGDRRDFCSRALGLLGMLPRSGLSGYSSAYETEPVGDVGGPFLNLVAKVETELPIHRLMEILSETERGLGRNLQHLRDKPLHGRAQDARIGLLAADNQSRQRSFYPR